MNKSELILAERWLPTPSHRTIPSSACDLAKSQLEQKMKSKNSYLLLQLTLLYYNSTMAEGTTEIDKGAVIENAVSTTRELWRAPFQQESVLLTDEQRQASWPIWEKRRQAVDSAKAVGISENEIVQKARDAEFQDAVEAQRKLNGFYSRGINNITAEGEQRDELQKLANRVGEGRRFSRRDISEVHKAAEKPVENTFVPPQPGGLNTLQDFTTITPLSDLVAKDQPTPTQEDADMERIRQLAIQKAEEHFKQSQHTGLKIGASPDELRKDMEESRRAEASLAKGAQVVNNAYFQDALRQSHRAYDILESATDSYFEATEDIGKRLNFPDINDYEKADVLIDFVGEIADIEVQLDSEGKDLNQDEVQEEAWNRLLDTHYEGKPIREYIGDVTYKDLDSIRMEASVAADARKAYLKAQDTLRLAAEDKKKADQKVKPFEEE